MIRDRKRIHLSCSASWELITLYALRLSAVSHFFPPSLQTVKGGEKNYLSLS